MNNLQKYQDLLNKSYKKFNSAKPTNFKINDTGIVEVYDKKGKILGIYSREMFDELRNIKDE